MNEIKIDLNAYSSSLSWLQAKQRHDPDYIKKITGDANYHNLRQRIMKRKSAMSPNEFAMMFVNELEILRYSSQYPAERNIADSIIRSINIRYENEKAEYLADQARQRDIYKKVDTYMQLLDCSPDDFIRPSKYGTNIDDNKALSVAKYMEFKRILYNKFAELPNPREEDYISLIISEKAIMMGSVINELEEKEAALARANIKAGQLKLKISDLHRELDNKCCSICMDDYKTNDEVFLLKCAHLFHVKCIDNWLEKQSTCPRCRCIK
jgi:hypothetical protein